MKRKQIAAFLLSAIFALTCASCASSGPASSGGEAAPAPESAAAPADSSEAPAEKPAGPATMISIGTSTIGGNFYVIGAGIASLLTPKMPQYDFTAEVTAGGNANCMMIQSGELEFATMLNSSAVDSRSGAGDWTNGQKLEKVLAAFPLSAYQFTLFTLDGNIKTFADFNGKTIGAGTKGAGPDLLFRKIVEKLGMNCEIHNDGYSQTVQALQDGVVDAVFTPQMAPWSALTELEASKEVFFPLFTDADIAAIKEIAPYLSDATIAAGSYKGLAAEYKTVADWGMMAVGADVPEEDVYEIVKAVFENYGEIKEIHSSCANIKPENTQYIVVPYHPGAAKYYKELGITVAE